MKKKKIQAHIYEHIYTHCIILKKKNILLKIVWICIFKFRANKLRYTLEVFEIKTEICK